MRGFVDSNKAEYGVEPICNEIRIAPSSDYAHKARERDPDRLPDRIQRDMRLELAIQRIWEGNFRVYGARKVWRQLLREGIGIARCTVARLMKKLGIQGIRRGKKCRTTPGDDLLDRPTDKVNRQFVATRPNPLWGGGYYLCGDVDWLCLCGFYHRCFCKIHRWLASESFIANGSGTGCIGTGAMVSEGNRRAVSEILMTMRWPKQ